MMEIKVLGTSATWPLPRRGRECFCPICQSKDKRDKRLRSAILLEINNKRPRKVASLPRDRQETRILIDCGPDIIKQLGREKISQIDFIVLTHAHSDHTSGLKSIGPHKLHKEGPVPIYAHSEVHKRLSSNFKKLKYQKKVIYPFKKFKISAKGAAPAVGQGSASGGENLEFSPLLVFHSKNFPTFAFKIVSSVKCQMSSVVYMPDYKNIPQKSIKEMKHADILILGGAILHRRIPWHRPIDEGIKTAKELEAKRVYFTHIGHQTLPHKELVKYVQRLGNKNFNVLYDSQLIRI